MALKNKTPSEDHTERSLPLWPNLFPYHVAITVQLVTTEASRARRRNFKSLVYFKNVRKPNYRKTNSAGSVKTSEKMMLKPQQGHAALKDA